jgi:peptide/nickel transport system substrate-binding protein
MAVPWRRKIVSSDGFWTRAAAGRLRRRRLLQASAAGAGVAALALAGCGTKTKSNGGSGSSGAAQQKRGGTLALSDNFQRGFDPHVLQATDTGSFGMFYSTLIRANSKTNALEPDLASKWESPSPTELVFTLAPNIKWHDKPPVSGRALTPDDILFSFQRLQTDDPRYINRAYFSSIDKMEAPDKQTLRLTLKSPDVTQLANLSVPSLKILAPEVVQKDPKLGSADSVVGTGAFVLQSSEVGVGSQLTRNPTYFKPGLPYADSINLHAFTDYNSEWSAFLAGQIYHRWVPGQDSSNFANSKQNDYHLDWFPDLGYEIIMANTTRPPFNDPRVTSALKLLVDHDELKTGWADVWFGRARFSTAFAAATADTWDLSEDEYRKHLEWQTPKDAAIKEALTRLAAAGFTKDKPLKFTVAGTNGSDYQTPLAQLAQAQLKRNSQGIVDTDTKYFDTTAWTQTRASGNFDWYMGGHSSGGFDPDTYFQATFKTGGGRNYGKFSDPKLDDMIAKQRTIFDEAQRKQAIRDIILYVIDNCPYSCVDSRYILNAASLKVQNFPVEGTTQRGGEHYESVSLT